jgi:hypothetical protein
MENCWLPVGESGAGAIWFATSAVPAIWPPLLSVILIFSGLCGLIAVVKPAWFSTLAEHGGQWIDTSRLVERLDARFDVDRYALRYPRAFGALVLLSALILAMSALKR